MLADESRSQSQSGIYCVVKLCHVVGMDVLHCRGVVGRIRRVVSTILMVAVKLATCLSNTVQDRRRGLTDGLRQAEDQGLRYFDRKDVFYGPAGIRTRDHGLFEPCKHGCIVLCYRGRSEAACSPPASSCWASPSIGERLRNYKNDEPRLQVLPHRHWLTGVITPVSLYL
jgi:hypothetical protein